MIKRIVSLVFVFLILCSCRISLAGATPQQHIGVHVHPTWDLNFDFQQLQAAKDAGATIIRLGPSWRLLEPVQGQYDFSWYIPALDQIVDKADELNLQILMMLGENPCWAAQDPKKNCDPGSENFRKWCPVGQEAAYAEAFKFMVDRYGDKVAAWEVWNEPNMPFFWCARPNPQEYSKLLQITYETVKKDHPDTVILGGSLAGSDLPFLGKMYEAGAVNYYDALALHPYTTDSPSTCNNPRWVFGCGVENTHNFMGEHKDTKPIWITEFGWSAFQGYGGVGPEKQVKYLDEALKMSSGYEYVPVIIWYDLRDDPGKEDNKEGHFGLYNQDLSPKTDLLEVYRK